MNAEPLKITDDDVDYVCEALIERLEEPARRALDLPPPTICQVYACERPRAWLAKLEAAHPRHGTPEIFEIEVCDPHAQDFRLDHFRNRLRWVGQRIQRYHAERLPA